MSEDQCIALGIFLLSYGLIVSDKVARPIASIFGALLAYLFLLSPHDLLHYENWETILFVFGMMTVIETMNESGFFRWLGLLCAKWVRLDPLRLYILFPFLSAFLSAFVDSITVMLFMSTLTIEVSRIIGMNPVPLILSEICGANIGGASTMVGDPPNVILGTYFGLSFFDFVRNTGPIAWIGFVINTCFFILLNRSEIYLRRRELRAMPGLLEEKMGSLRPKEAIADRRLFVSGLISFVYVVFMLVTHHITHTSVALCALTSAVIAMLLGGPKMSRVLLNVDYPTIVFFAGLFLIVGAMEKVGLLTMAASLVHDWSHGQFFLALSLILWIAAIGSSFVDNVPFAATMAPILRHMSENFGFPLLPLVWATALGTDIGGNGTPIGASANVVALAVYERMQGERIRWGYYMKVCYPAMMTVILVSNLLIYLFHLP